MKLILKIQLTRNFFVGEEDGSWSTTYPYRSPLFFWGIVLGGYIDYVRHKKTGKQENVLYTRKKSNIILALFATAFLMLVLSNIMSVPMLQYIGSSVLIGAAVLNVQFMWKEYKGIGIGILGLIVLANYLLFF